MVLLGEAACEGRLGILANHIMNLITVQYPCGWLSLYIGFSLPNPLHGAGDGTPFEDVVLCC
jgi:hypothetical protein